MIIRYTKDSEATTRDAFEAYDDTENLLGAVRVQGAVCPLLLAKRPGIYTIYTNVKPEAMDALIGAATAQALRMAMEDGSPSCVRVARAPGDESIEPLLHSLGYSQASGVIRMRAPIGGGPITVPIPEGLTVVRDYLNDERERRFFLERSNMVFGTQWDADWLAQLRAKELFTRILLVEREGLAGEMIAWADGPTGVVESLYVHPDWRRKGAARFLLEIARIYWLEHNLREGRMDVWDRLQPAYDMAYSARFRPIQTVQEYACMDVL